MFCLIPPGCVCQAEGGIKAETGAPVFSANGSGLAVGVALCRRFAGGLPCVGRLGGCGGFVFRIRYCRRFRRETAARPQNRKKSQYKKNGCSNGTSGKTRRDFQKILQLFLCWRQKYWFPDKSDTSIVCRIIGKKFRILFVIYRRIILCRSSSTYRAGSGQYRRCPAYHPAGGTAGL